MHTLHVHRNKNGRIVSVKAAAAGKKAYKNISKWTQAVSKARKALGLKGFVPVGGSKLAIIFFFGLCLGKAKVYYPIARRRIATLTSAINYTHAINNSTNSTTS